MGNAAPGAPRYRATCSIFRYTRSGWALFARPPERLEVLLVEGEGSVKQVHVRVHRLSQHLLEGVHLLLRARHQVLGDGLAVLHPLAEFGGHVPEEALDEVRTLLLERRGPLDDLPVGLQALGEGAVGALLAPERLLHDAHVGLHSPGERPVGLRLALEYAGQALDPALGELHVSLLGVHGALHHPPVGLAERLTQPPLRLGPLLFGHLASSYSRYFYGYSTHSVRPFSVNTRRATSEPYGSLTERATYASHGYATVRRPGSLRGTGCRETASRAGRGPGPGRRRGHQPRRCQGTGRRRLSRARSPDNPRRRRFGRRRGGRAGGHGPRAGRRGLLHARGLWARLQRSLRRVPRRKSGHRGEEARLALARGGRCRPARRGHGVRGPGEAPRREGRRDYSHPRWSRRRGLFRRPDRQGERRPRTRHRRPRQPGD